MADDSQGASSRQPECRTIAPIRGRDGWVDARGTLPLWRGRAKSVRRDCDHAFDGSCHDVSVTAVWRLGLGSKTAVLTMRPR